MFDESTNDAPSANSDGKAEEESEESDSVQEIMESDDDIMEIESDEEEEDFSEEEKHIKTDVDPSTDSCSAISSIDLETRKEGKKTDAGSEPVVSAIVFDKTDNNNEVRNIKNPCLTFQYG